MKNLRSVLGILIVVSMICGIMGCSAQVNVTPSRSGEGAAGNTAELEYWSEDSVAAASIRDYVARVTDKNSDSFIPVEDSCAPAC